MVELLNNLQIATVDLTPQFKGRGADGLYLDADRHFSVSGHRAAAEAVAELIRPML
jgi:lysophospholipase L1-like esterase